MPGLLYKDFWVMKKDLFLGGIGVVFFSIPLFLPWEKILRANQISPEILNGERMTYAVLPLFVYFAVFEIVAAVQNGIFSHDERKVWSSYVMASPLGAKGQVLSKYYLTFALSAAAFLWGHVCDVVPMLAFRIAGSASVIYSSLFLIQIFLRSIELPFLIHFGQKHGRIYKILMFALILFAGIVYALFGKLPDFITLEDGFELLLRLQADKGTVSVFGLGVRPLFFAVVMLLYYLSYRISYRLYRRGTENYEA